MKQIQIGEPFHVRVREDAQIPTPNGGEALLYCGICGADLASYTGNQPFTTYPRVPGHEFSARIRKIKKEIKRFPKVPSYTEWSKPANTDEKDS